MLDSGTCSAASLGGAILLFLCLGGHVGLVCTRIGPVFSVGGELYYSWSLLPLFQLST